MRKRVAVLISGRGSNMAALIAAAKKPGYPAEIALVLSNRPAAVGLATARAAGIATAVVDHATYGNDREAFERAMQAQLDQHRIELVCLAGFMRLLTHRFVEAWTDRMINIHPSLLPAFPGLHTHRRALQEGVKLHGCTVHFVTPQVDHGPIIIQAAVPVRAGDSEAALTARVLRQEHRIYPLAMRWLVEGRLVVENGLVRVNAPEASQSILAEE